VLVVLREFEGSAEEKESELRTGWQAEAQCHLVFERTGIRQKLWGRLATCGGLLTRRKPL
jgi:hypothetical protein